MTGSGTVLVVGLGDLGTRILLALAASSRVRQLVAAGRDSARGEAAVNSARLLSRLQSGPRDAQFRQIDLDKPATIRHALGIVHPDIVVTAASAITWWRSPARSPGRQAELEALPYGAWLPLQIDSVRKLTEAVRAFTRPISVVSLPYPDAVGPALAPLGLAPDLGAGNVAEVAAKLQAEAAVRHRVSPDSVDVRLIMHHAAERYAFDAFQSLGSRGHLGEPPWYADVRVEDRTLSQEEVSELFHTPFSLPEGRETHAVTAAATVNLVEALLADTPTRTHAPAPHGLPGGYPVTVSRHGVDLDLPGGVERDEAIDLNARAARWDGIESVAADGTVDFTQEVADATERVLGLRLARLAPADVVEVALEMLSRARE